MPPLDPLRPGELRIRSSHSAYQNIPTYRPTYQAHRHHSGGIGGVLVCILSLFFVFKGCDSSSGGYSGSLGSSASSVTPTQQIASSSSPSHRFLAPPPIRPGKYAAIIRREEGRNVDAIVFTYDKVQIITVDSESELQSVDDLFPNLEQTNPARSVMPAGRSQVGDEEIPGFARALSNYRTLENLHRGIVVAPPLHLKDFGFTQRSSPRVIRGDVIVEVGPLVNRNHLKAHLIAKHGGLKAATIDIIDGAPRGPPELFGLERPVVTVYVVGRVLKFSGPVQRGQSTLNASILDLGPTPEELDRYKPDATQWVQRVQSEYGREVTPYGRLFDPHYPYGEHRPMWYDSEGAREYRAPEYHAPEYHPPAFEAIP